MPKVTIKKIEAPRSGAKTQHQRKAFGAVAAKPEEKVQEKVELITEEPETKEDEVLDIAKIEKDLASKPDKYFEAIGRRKTAVARVRLFTRGEKEFLVNGRKYRDYFSLKEDQETAAGSLSKMKCLDKFKVTVLVKGGGRHAQAEAVRHGIARVLVDFNNSFRKRLRKAGYLTRDPRMRERKKFGLKRARRAPQWSKR